MYVINGMLQAGLRVTLIEALCRGGPTKEPLPMLFRWPGLRRACFHITFAGASAAPSPTHNRESPTTHYCTVQHHHSCPYRSVCGTDAACSSTNTEPTVRCVVYIHSISLQRHGYRALWRCRRLRL